MDPMFRPIYAHNGPKLSWRASETVLELDNQPHLLTRIEIRGRAFPHMDAEPFVRIAGRRGGTLSWFANVADDGSSLSGYFAVDAFASGGILEYGYGNRVFERIKGFEPGKIERLDKRKLPKDLVVVTDAYIQRKREGTAAGESARN